MTRKSLLLGLMWTFAALTQLSAQCDCVTTGNCPVPINDNGIYNGTLDVTVNGSNDLSQCPLTSVCLTITHTWIGDLSVSLTSPGGLHYLVMADAGNNYGNCGTQQDNAEICITLGTGNPLTNNTEYQCNAAPCSVGTCCLNGNNWTMPCGGVIDPITGAVQAPNCNLNDFNVAGQPANGTWTLSVSDVCNMDVGILQNFSLTFACGIQSCIVCEADAGELDSLEIITCLGDSSLLLDIPPDYGSGSPPDTNEYSYAYIISQNGIILSIDSVADLTSQPAGVYGVYGFSYLISDSLDLASLIGLDTALAISQLESSTSPFCGDFSDNAIPVTIVPVIPVTVINTSVCQGDCITVGGQPVCSSATLTLASWLGCDSVVQVNLTTIPPDTVAYTATVCAGNCVTIGGQPYCPPGQFFVHLQTWQGCDSVVHLTFNVLSPTAVINPASPPALTCTTTSMVLDASSSGPGLLTFAWAGPSGFSSTQSAVIATTAGTYTVTVSNNTLSPACTSTASVTVANGVVPPDLVVSGPAPAICLGATFDLATASVVDVNNTNSNITVHSGTPATPANQLSNLLVSPSATTTYYFKATKGICSDETSLVLTVTPVPTGDFSATSAICTGTSATVNYTGTGTAGATYNWNFGGGTATPGTGPGPHTVTWPTTGVKLVTLTVVENNCASNVFSQTVSVESPLLMPNISCSTTTSSVLFSWSNVPGNAGYNVTVLTGQTGSQQTSNSYLVSNLNSGDVVTIQVVAIGTGACGSSMAQHTCAAANCPPGTVDIAPVSDICADASMAAFNLQATMTGGTAGGTLTWSGTGITNPATGTFDPNQANPGANTITATYQNGNCGYTNNLIINVFQTPSADFTVQSPVCAGDASAIVFTGTTGPGSIFTWDFDGGTATPGTGQGPHSVTWSASGTYTVSLTVENADGCVSAPVSAAVQVDAPLATPVINCSATTESVTFSWGAVPGAIGYGVNVLSGQTATQISPTSYEVTNLQPGEQVSIEVTALSGNACGNTMATQTCAAMDCPTVTIAIDPVADICLDAASQPVQLVANVTGGSASGTLTWTGNAVSTAGIFDPSQASIGLNTVTATYQEANCLSTEDLEIYVYQTPVAGFTAPASACAGTAVTINFSGAVQPGLAYTWDFGGGTASPGTGSGPHSVTWATDGQQVVTLTVSSPNGCVSSIFSSLVQVDLPLQNPQITCSNTTTSIEFTWLGVPGASAYNVTVNTGQSGTQTSPTTYLVMGLQPDEQVCVTVTATGAGA
ncbi:MAG: proprotein convertase P-domain-containing protein, partial [Bacteroidetes bacterium]|nr:proprotein convertase P-domain-containing protein [Bacteroidota bacterium]